MAKIDQLLEKYGESHQNATNKLVHWVCVPAIMFSLIGLLYAIPFPAEKTWYSNWAALALLFALVYYIRLSPAMFAGFVVIAFLLLYGNASLHAEMNFDNRDLALTSVAIFVAAWIGQFIGHKIEGKKPSFLEDIQFLLIGPAWLLHFIFKKLGIRYSADG